MKECSKSIPRQRADANFARHYMGHGVDIGFMMFFVIPESRISVVRTQAWRTA